MKECKAYLQTANESSPRVLCANSSSQLGGLEANAKRKKNNMGNILVIHERM